MRGIVRSMGLMRRGTSTLCLFLTALAAPAFAQEPAITPLLAQPVLGFEREGDWRPYGATPDYLVGMVKTEGTIEPEAVVIAAKPGAMGALAGVTRFVPVAAYRGQRVRLSARLKSRDVGNLRMLLRVAGPAGMRPRFDNMTDRPITGTTGWRTYDIVMDVPENATEIRHSLFIADGKGVAWGESFRLETVGPDVAVTRPELAGTGGDAWQRSALPVLTASRNRPAMTYDLRPDNGPTRMGFDGAGVMNGHVLPGARDPVPFNPYSSNIYRDYSAQSQRPQ
jgi:hypothetical protein